MLDNYLKTDKDRIMQNIRFCCIGKNNQNLIRMKEFYPNAEFLNLVQYTSDDFRNHRQNVLTPTFEIRKKYIVDIELAAKLYRQYIASSKARKDEVARIINVAKTRLVFLVGFFKDFSRDFRGALVQYIRNELQLRNEQFDARVNQEMLENYEFENQV